MSELTRLTIADARAGLKQKKFSAAELADAHLAAIEKARSLNAYVLETPERAAAMAKAADARIAKGDAGPLEGIPLAIKDMFCTKGVRTTACSRILDNFVPTYESTVSGNLWRDGAVLLGKTNNDEFAMGSSNETSFMGPVTSPWRRKGANTPLVPGGSSGGSAAAVAAHLALGATGTDTGGSIRQPAAFTGIVGIKPTYGRCSRWGIVAFASSLDQAGPFTRTVRDSAIMLRSMAGHDAKDTTSVDIAVPDYEAAVGKSIKGKKIGIPKEYRIDGMPAEIEKLWEQGRAWLKAAGAELVEVSLPHTKYALPAYYIVRRRRLRPISRVTTVCVTASACPPRYHRHVREYARRRLRQGSAPAHHDRHLRVVRRLLRRVLPARAKGAHPDQKGFRGLLRTRHRRDADAGNAVGGFRRRREGSGRSDRDVLKRRVHGDGEHGGPAGHLGAGRA